MNLTPSDIGYIKRAFSAMKTKEDLLALLNYIKPLLYGKSCFPFELKQLTWYANPVANKKRYTRFTIEKKSGATRAIHAPVKGLKVIQRVLNLALQAVFEPHKAASGFVKGKSIVDNARIHASSNYVYNIDLRNFFPSIDQARVWKCFQLRPFNLAAVTEDQTEGERALEQGEGFFTNDFGEIVFYSVDSALDVTLNKNKGDFRKYKKRFTSVKKPSGSTQGLTAKVEALMIADATKYIIKTQKAVTSQRRLKLASILAALCCTEMTVRRKNSAGKWETLEKNVLPQGAPTSPVISNIVCQKLDFLLTAVSKRFGLKYSRYADDITFSSMHNVYQAQSEFLKELSRVIESQNFHIKACKTRLQKEGFRQEVTGLVVNDKVNVQQRYIKRLRMWLYYWERYGYEKASEVFRQQYIADRGYAKGGNPNMKAVIGGKMEFLKMVKGEGNKMYQGLKKRFDNLKSLDSPINIVLDIWEREGIDKAVTSYYKLAPYKISKKIKTLTDFMTDLLADKRLTEQDRQRFFNLITTAPTHPADKENKQNKEEVEEPHTPMLTAQKLKLFKTGNRLKWITHVFPNSDVKAFNYDRVTSDAIAEFTEISDSLPKNLIGIISMFLKPRKRSTSSKFRYLDDSYETWWSNNVKKWCREHPNLHPDTNKKISRQIIMPFKKSIEIRDGNDLIEAINYKLRKTHGQEIFEELNIDFNGVKRATRFFTGVDQLMSGIVSIFSPIIDRKNISNNIHLASSISEANGQYVTQITITHLGSDLDQEFSQSLFTNGDFNTAKMHFNSLCDWEIVANFTDGSYSIPMLYSGPERPAIKVLQVQGFTHKLIFY